VFVEMKAEPFLTHHSSLLTAWRSPRLFPFLEKYLENLDQLPKLSNALSDSLVKVVMAVPAATS